MHWQKIKQRMGKLLRKGFSTSHNRIVTCGLLVGLCYLPWWLADIIVGTLQGAASLVMVAAAVLGLHLLWKDRQRLAQLKAESEDRWLGYCIVISGIVLSPFCAFSEWSQKLIWIFILVGIGCSTWGIRFFQKYPMPVFLIAFGFFPAPTTVSKAIWDAFTPPQLLERLMAWAATSGFKLIGQSAELRGTVITLPGGAVDVAWGCSGFDMATIIAAASLVLGLFLKQSLPKVLVMVITGIVLALLFNVPRIMLMAASEAYWGKAVFEFWHGFWGGQIFSTILFTIYYYAVVAIIKRRTIKSTI